MNSKKSQILLLTVLSLLLIGLVYRAYVKDDVATADKNNDGKPDEWSYFNWKGELLRFEKDKNKDGIPDTWDYYGPNNVPAKSLYDTNGDNQADTWTYYNEKGVRIRIERDLNFDQKADSIMHFDPAIQQPYVKSEVDADFDGVFEKVEDHILKKN